MAARLARLGFTMMRAISRGAGLVLGAALVTACGSFREREEAIKLENTLDAYEAAVRWRGVHTAYSFLLPEKAAELNVPEDLDGVQVVGYEVVVPPVKLDAETAQQTVVIHYLRIDQQTVKSRTDRQTWVYDPQTKLWRLSSGVPDFP